MKPIIFGLFLLSLLACYSQQQKPTPKATYPDVRIAGAMRNVMWKGELAGIIRLDTISYKKNWYGLGPLSGLRGELLVKNGQTYVSKVLTDSSMVVDKTAQVSAPFFVYGQVNEWEEMLLPKTVKTIQDLETLIDQKTLTQKRPFAFRLNGRVTSALIHIQNLPEGTAVSSPQEAHQGQVKYALQNEWVDIIGFFSTAHQGIFTHHDSYLHLHLINRDEGKMGHLDQVQLDSMILYLPKK
ncbi:MAG: acetolactate decarboxylase [Bacteroidota bacterium]